MAGLTQIQSTLAIQLAIQLEVNAGPQRACTACAKPSFHSLARNAPSVQPNQGKTHAIHTWLSGTIWYCRGPRKHDNDTGDVARGQRWSTPCMHCVRKAEFSLLGPKCPVGAVQPRRNIRNPHLALQNHLVLPRAAKTWPRHRIRRNPNDGTLIAPAVLWCHMGLGSGMRLRALCCCNPWFC